MAGEARLRTTRLRSRRDTFIATDRGRVWPLGRPFFARVSNLDRPAAAPMAVAPAGGGGQAVDDRARPVAVGNCDLGRVRQSKSLYAGVFGRGRRQPGGVATRNPWRSGKRDLIQANVRGLVRSALLQ